MVTAGGDQAGFPVPFVQGKREQNHGKKTEQVEGLGRTEERTYADGVTSRPTTIG